MRNMLLARYPMLARSPGTLHDMTMRLFVNSVANQVAAQNTIPSQPGQSNAAAASSSSSSAPSSSATAAAANQASTSSNGPSTSTSNGAGDQNKEQGGKTA